MSLHKDPELKAAILDLSPKEKDKLLVRLVGKDKMLMKQLHFQLLEDEVDLEDRIITLKERLHHLFEQSPHPIKNSPNVNYILALNRLIKQASGLINEHEKVTRDKMSEVEFRAYILLESIHRYPQLFAQPHLMSCQKLLKYFAGRIKHLLAKYDKLHEDLQFEFREDVQALLDFAHLSPMAPHLASLGLPKEL